MRVFVTGATRVLGRPVVQQLVAGGHHVLGLSRSEANAATLRELGAQPVQADVFDVVSLRQALVGCEAVLHLATRIPPAMQMRREAAWQENDRIRRDGTANLVKAALSAESVGVFVYESFAPVYADGGSAWIDAANGRIAPRPTLLSTLDAEVSVAHFAAQGRRGISLRLGYFYGPESPATGDMLRMARLGVAPLPGPAEAYFPQIWVRDAAGAVVAAAVQPVPAGIYDIVDDEPLTRGELFAEMAQAVGRHNLRQLPAPAYRALLGTKYEEMTRSQRISNRRFRAAAGWQPAVPNAHAGWALMRAAGVPARATT